MSLSGRKNLPRVAVWIALGLSAIGLESASGSSADPLFYSSFTAFDAIPGVAPVTLADLNGDGHPDVVAASAYAGALGVLLGRGDGTFAPVSQVTVGGNHPAHVAIADLNGDGHPDAVTANQFEGTISVLLGRGDGTFDPSRDFPAGDGPAWVAVGDVDRDGKADLVLAPNLDVLIGNGDGTFRRPVAYPVGVAVRSVALADFDGDGWLDAAAGYEGGGTFIYVLLGDRQGGFAAATGYDSGYNPRIVTVADVNRDGRADIVVAGLWSNNVTIHLGRGDGSLAPKISRSTGARPEFLAVADVDGDGNPDVVTANDAYNTISVLRGDGSGQFPTRTDIGTGFYVQSIAAADLNQDGKPDVITYGSTAVIGGSSSIFVHLGNGDGSFGRETDRRVPAGPVSLVTGDWNRDGWPDLAVASTNADSVRLLLGAGDGTLTSGPAFATMHAPVALETADLDGDGKLDLLATTQAATVSAWRGNGDATFAGGQEFATGPHPQGLATADLDGDGTLDVVTANLGTIPLPPDPTFPVGPDSISILFGHGDGSFAPHVDLEAGLNPVALAIVDLDGDGALDLAVADAYYLASSVSVFLGNGNGSFQPRYDYPTGSGPRDVVAADVNRDGIPDLLTANAVDETVSILLGLGGGAFDAPRAIPMIGSPRALGIADFNQDGAPDVAVATDFTNTVAILLSHGDATFEPALRFGSWAGPYDLAILDVDRDSHPDLAAADFDAGSVTLLRNSGMGSNTAVPLALASVDVRDGEVRLVWITSQGPGAIATIERREEGEPSTSVGQAIADGSGLVTFVDRAVRAGARYGYRARVAGETSAEVWVVVPETAALSLEGFRPNPATSLATVRFSLPSAEPASLEVFDALGRRVVERDLGSLPPGPHDLPLRGLGAGIYVLKLTQGGRSVATKAAVIH